MKNVKGNFILQDSLIYKPSLPRAHLFPNKHYRFWMHYSCRARLYIQKQIMRLLVRTLICYVSFKINNSSRRLLLLLPTLVIYYTNYQTRRIITLSSSFQRTMLLLYKNVRLSYVIYCSRYFSTSDGPKFPD